jgi:hypothetical protein
MLRQSLFLALTLPIWGCVDDLKISVGKCEYEAQKAFPKADLSRSVDMGRMIKACMKAKGYEHDWRLDRCHASFETEGNADCYRPIR